jgi:hypothetical protein
MTALRFRYWPPFAILALVFAWNPAYATAQRAPVIQRLEPSSGPPGTAIVIDGQRFREPVQVALGETQLPVDRVLPNRIAARVPAGARTDFISVKTPDGQARGPEFRLTEPLAVPEITGFEPHQGAPGTEVLIAGRNFAARLVCNMVTIGDVPLIVRYASPTELKVIVPEIGKTGLLTVQVQQAGSARSDKPFRVMATTSIKDIQPTTGLVGSKVVITGAGFSPKLQDNRVYLNNVAMPVERASERELVVIIPERAVTGPLLVDVRGAGRDRSKEPLVVQRVPTMVGFSPTQGLPGAKVKLFGTNFGREAKAVQVRLGTQDKALLVYEVKETEIVVAVPEAAQSGKFAVRVNGAGPAYSAESFRVVPSLRISGFAPKKGIAGTVVTIDGSGFSPDPAQNTVRLGQNVTEVISASPARLRVRVGNGPSVPLEVSVQGSGTARSEERFLVTHPPQISSFEPKMGPVGTDVRIYGSAFGHNASAIKVTLGGKPLQVVSVREDGVVARVTAECKSGRIEVTVATEGSDFSPSDFQVTKTQKP